MGFVNSNIIGRSGEKFVLNLLHRYGYDVKLNEDKEQRSFYDIIWQVSPKKQIFIESKLDKMASETGNIAVEFYNPKLKQDSGINITKAHIYSYVLLDEGNPTVWFASVPKLKDFLKTVKPHKTIVAGGDKNASLYLYKCEIILDAVFNRMENLAEEAEFHAVMKKLTGKEKAN